MSEYLGDVVSLATADGEVWYLPDGERFLTAYGGFGMPPTTYVTGTAFRQSFARERAVLYGTRDISLSFHQVWHGDRADYWQKRAELMDLFRFNRGGPMTLTLITMAGRKRALDVYANPGPMLPAGDPAGDVWAIDDSFTMTAFDPIWRDPDPVIRSGAQAFESGFVFPITFPITFGRAGAQYVFSEPYAGTFDSYPTFTLTGPYQRAVFTAEANGASFSLEAAVAAGEQRIVTLEPTSRSILDANDVSHLDELGDGFDLIRFMLLAAPYAPDPQTIRVAVFGSTPSTTVQLSYYERYLGI